MQSLFCLIFDLCWAVRVCGNSAKWVVKGRKGFWLGKIAWEFSTRPHSLRHSTFTSPPSFTKQIFPFSFTHGVTNLCVKVDDWGCRHPQPAVHPSVAICPPSWERPSLGGVVWEVCWCLWGRWWCRNLHSSVQQTCMDIGNVKSEQAFEYLVLLISLVRRVARSPCCQLTCWPRCVMEAKRKMIKTHLCHLQKLPPRRRWCLGLRWRSSIGGVAV